MPLTFFFLLGVTNAINLADGLDGLAGGTTLLSLAALALLAWTSGLAFVGGVAIIISGAILGFLRFNTHPARVFMGDGGSQILGFSAAVLAVVLTQDRLTPLSSALPLLLLGIPIIDTLMVMTQRLLERRSPFSADRNHIHHRLLARGFDHHEAVVAIYLLQSGMFVTAWFLRYESDVTIVSAFVVFSLLTIGVLQLAASRDWRWRPPAPRGETNASTLSRAVAWLRAPAHLPLWTLVAIGSISLGFFASSASIAQRASPDVRVLATAMAALVALLVVVQWRRQDAGRIVRVLLYVAVVMATYLGHEADIAQRCPIAQWSAFALLIICVSVRFRLASDRRFRVTSLDVLVIFAAVIVPNLPGSIVDSAHLGESIARLIAMMYGVEALFSAGAHWWRVPCVGAVGFLLICAGGGI
jgi:UDP-GlcNAc:undecaprenyl-phosphate GlcNAc-1-phosphate transferase